MTSLFHPATIELLKLQSRGRRRRMFARFSQPRRLILSALAGVLAVVWLGNVAIAVWLREAAAPETLSALLSFGLVFYAGWHFTKAAFFRPESPFDWTSAEHDLLAAMPLLPRDLVAYQLASVTVTTLVKSGLFALLLLPDLRCVPLGFVGLVLAMMTLELLRLAIAIATWGMSRSAYLAYRAVVLAGLVAAGFAVGAAVVHEGGLASPLQIGGGFRERLVSIVMQLDGSAFGYAAFPFQPMVDLVLANGLAAGHVGLAFASSIAIAGLAAAVIGLYGVTSQRMALRERRDYQTRSTDHGERSPARGAEVRLSLRHIPRWGGAGALAWRQLLGAWRHWGSLLTAMIAPAVLAGAQIFIFADPHIALLATAGTLAFYTFLLLPTALRFDFRRDIDRLATLKGLPVAPAAAAIGQTLAPVLIATLFQAGVLAYAIAMRSLPLHFFVTTLLVILPLNVMVFGLDNLIFLLYPYRVQQEGLEVFLRTMLTFTGKGLLFALGLAAMSAWAFAAAAVARGMNDMSGGAIAAYPLFITGTIAGPSIAAAFVLYALCQTYRRVDPIEDVPR